MTIAMNIRNWPLRGRVMLASLAALLVLATAIGFASRDADAETVPEIQAMPVEMTTLSPQAVKIWKSFSGRLVAVDEVEIRPQVSGRITEIHFTDGQHVEKDAVLYVIDPRPYEAALKQAQADLNVAQNTLNFAIKEYDRAEELIKSEAITKRLVEERLSAKNIGFANVQNAKSKIELAKLDLEYAHVKSPIAGRVGRAEITRGNLVEAGPNAPLLTTVVSSDGIYADFEVDEQTYLSHVRSHSSNLESEHQIPVKLVSKDGSISIDGKIHTFDNKIDTATGTIRARAHFANADASLLPGMVMSVQLGSAASEQQLLVPERAIGTDQNRKFVYVVNDESKASYREVTLGEAIDGQRVVQSGLKAGDTVITSGISLIRPDTLVSKKQPDAQALSQTETQ